MDYLPSFKFKTRDPPESDRKNDEKSKAVSGPTKPVPFPFLTPYNPFIHKPPHPQKAKPRLTALALSPTAPTKTPNPCTQPNLSGSRLTNLHPHHGLPKLNLLPPPIPSLLPPSSIPTNSFLPPQPPHLQAPHKHRRPTTHARRPRRPFKSPC